MALFLTRVENLKTFHFSTGFYTLYIPLSTRIVENPVESVENSGLRRMVFHHFPVMLQFVHRFVKRNLLKTSGKFGILKKGASWPP